MSTTTKPPGLDEFLAFSRAHVQAQEDAEAGRARWCWSVDEETYCAAETEADAHGAAIDRIESEAEADGQERAYWIARQRPAEAFINCRWFGESIAERLDELLEEIAIDDPAVELSPQDQTDLAAMVLAFVRLRNGFRRFGIAQESIAEHRHMAVGGEE